MFDPHQRVEHAIEEAIGAGDASSYELAERLVLFG